MNRRTMMTTLAGGVVAVGYADRAKAAPLVDGKLPVASADAAKDFPGAKELPDPNTNYRVVFSVGAKVKDDELLDAEDDRAVPQHARTQRCPGEESPYRSDVPSVRR